MIPVEFATKRGDRLDAVDAEILPVVTKALEHWSAKGDWYESIVEGASVLWQEMFEESVPDADTKQRDELLGAFQADLRKTLAKTGNPADAPPHQADRLAKWVATSTANHAELRAARVNEHPSLRWVTRHDDRVRSSHAAIDGTTVPAGQTFKVGDVHLAYPGEPVGDPKNWIECRCLLQRVGEGKSVAGNQTAFTEQGALVAAAEKTPPGAEGTEPDEPTTEDVHEDDTIDAVAGTDVPFHGVAAPTDVPSGDGRQLQKDGFSTRPFPLFLNFQRGSFHGGDPGPAVTVGLIDAMAMDPATGLVHYEGRFTPNTEQAATAEAIQHVIDGTMSGVSVDLSDTVMEQPDWDDEETMAALDDGTYISVFTSWRVAGATMVAFPAFEQAFIALGPSPVPIVGNELGAPSLDDEVGDPGEDIVEDGIEDDTVRASAVFAPGTHDGPGWITDPVPTGRIRRYWVSGEGSKKINWGVPGDFNRCRAELGKYVTNPDWLAGLCANMHKEALGVWPGQEDGGRDVAGLVAAGAKMAAAINLVASGAPDLPPGDWFQDPKLSAPTPFTVMDDGRVFGHVATWGTCHIGFDKVCTTAPSSPSGYAYYRTGELDTTLGPVSVGQITMGAGHASMKASAQSAAAHYDNVAHAVADVAAGEDAHGIWVAGSMRPGVSEEDVKALRAASLSGDWRRIRGNMEMVAALAVNVPGFPIPRNAIAASGQEQVALVAAGVVQEEQPHERQDLSVLVATEVERVLARREKLAATKARAALAARQARLSAARRIKGK